MTITINYLDNGLGIEIIATGTVTGHEIIEKHKEIYNSENLSKQRYQIIDRTHCQKYIVSNEEVMQIAKIDKEAAKTNPNIIIAVISSTDVQYGISRVWQAYVSESTFVTKVFRDRKDAELWLKEQLGK